MFSWVLAVDRGRRWQAQRVHGLKGMSSMPSNLSLVRLSIRADRDSMGVSGMIFGRQKLSNRFCNAWVLTSKQVHIQAMKIDQIWSLDDLDGAMNGILLWDRSLNRRISDA